MKALITEKRHNRKGNCSWVVSQTVTAPDEETLREEINAVLPHYGPKVKVYVDQPLQAAA